MILNVTEYFLWNNDFLNISDDRWIWQKIANKCVFVDEVRKKERRARNTNIEAWVSKTNIKIWVLGASEDLGVAVLIF
jgi:hypothetical protein